MSRLARVVLTTVTAVSGVVCYGLIVWRLGWPPLSYHDTTAPAGPFVRV